MDQKLSPEELSQAHNDLFGTPCAMTQCGECDEFVPVHLAVVTTHHITEHITNWRKLHGVNHVE
jgi:hypothetical protein